MMIDYLVLVVPMPVAAPSRAAAVAYLLAAAPSRAAAVAYRLAAVPTLAAGASCLRPT